MTMMGAKQTFELEVLNVRFGSKADISRQLNERPLPRLRREDRTVSCRPLPAIPLRARF
jgi:hypothetical protein